MESIREQINPAKKKKVYLPLDVSRCLYIEGSSRG